MTARREKSSNVYSAKQLRCGLESSLSAYTMAATAAGVGLLAFATPVEAKIIYTPAHIQIPVNGGRVPLDVNLDGTTDFYFWNSFRTASDGESGLLAAAGNDEGNRVRGRGSFRNTISYPFASALRAGFKVGPSRSYFRKVNHWLMAFAGYDRSGSTTYGQWLYTQHRYLGLRFVFDGQVHFGWARFSVIPSAGKFSALVTGYAYETIPNKPIIAGKTKGPDVTTVYPASLGRLAAGAIAIPASHSGR